MYKVGSPVCGPVQQAPGDREQGNMLKLLYLTGSRRRLRSLKSALKDRCAPGRRQRFACMSPQPHRLPSARPYQAWPSKYAAVVRSWVTLQPQPEWSAPKVDTSRAPVFLNLIDGQM
ncbi:MAG TPA: hypothetical protein VGS41_05720 [Chthonomonadales bacterium]|nr:hypothetical protein [Chthonomonadales bacterium]